MVYQVYPRSFQDSNGDGVGDLEGIRRRLDHLAWLGVDAVWLTPINPSADDDFGYDVIDFYGVHPAFGTLDDLDRLVAEARERGIHVLLDLVPNHTSDRCPWFAGRPDWYVWADRPNNWRSVFGGPAWTWDERRGAHYLHQFLPSQPDLDWWNPEVRAEFVRILRFWFDRGVAGFRIDCANRMVKDRELRDNPPAGPEDHWQVRRLGQRPVYSSDRPEVHEVFRRWREVCREYGEERVLAGETWFFDVERLAPYYGADDELHLAFNFLLTHAPFDVDVLRSVVEATRSALPGFAYPAWAIGNHDVPRYASRWCEGDPERARLAVAMLLTIPGTPFLYQGDELGLVDGDVPAERAQDPLFHRFPGQRRGRDPERTPMPWTGEPHGGFCPDDVEPWLPLGGVGTSVGAQLADRSSTLHLARDLVAFRRRLADLRTGGYARIEGPPGIWCFRRGERVAVALNFTGEKASIPMVGTLLRSTRHERRGDFDGSLAPWEGVVLGS